MNYGNDTKLNISRRRFIQSSALMTGGLIVGIEIPLAFAANTDQPPLRRPSSFIQIAPDDTITLTVPGVEMGQGAHTALPMIMMDELEGNWEKLRVQDAPVGDIYKNPWMPFQMTVGSLTTRAWYTDLRRSSAAAREMLIRAAASRWGVSPNECVASNSIITHRPSKKTFTFGQVASDAAKLDYPKNPKLKSSNEFRFIGKSVARTDIEPKVDGSAKFGIDVTLPNMLYAAVKTSPSFGGKLKSFDDAQAKKMAGYHATVPLMDGVVVVAKSYWQAKKALDKVKIKFDHGSTAQLDSKKISAILKQALDEKTDTIRNDGDTGTALQNAETLIESVYEVPYLAHACMEPMNCTVHVTENGCDIWASTQAPGMANKTAAAILNMDTDKIRVHSMYLGGGFGRRGESDYVAQAVIVGKAVGQPVKLIWSREEDIQHDYYRPSVAVKFKAGLDKQGNLDAIDTKIATSAMPKLEVPGPPVYARGMFDTVYTIPNFHVSGVNKELGIPFGFWRSVSHSHNPFMLESFIDELAHSSNKDPYLFRRSLLQGKKAQRHLGVLEIAAEKAGWGKPLAKGHYQGIAATEAYGSWIGCVAEISVKNKAITFHRIVYAFDCGTAVNPSIIEAQLEGAMVYGLTAALRGEITINKGAVEQNNFHDYRMLLINEMPSVEIHLVDSGEHPGGVGEPGTTPIAPALVNAIFAATGERIRSLPLSKHGFTLA